MADEAQTVIQYQVTGGIDLPSVLSALGIEFLTVSDQRMLVIYARSILNVNVSEGNIQNAGVLEVTVLDHDPNGGVDEPIDLVKKLIERIANAAESDLSPMI